MCVKFEFNFDSCIVPQSNFLIFNNVTHYFVIAVAQILHYINKVSLISDGNDECSILHRKLPGAYDLLIRPGFASYRERARIHRNRFLWSMWCSSKHNIFHTATLSPKSHPQRHCMFIEFHVLTKSQLKNH